MKLQSLEHLRTHFHQSPRQLDLAVHRAFTAVMNEVESIALEPQAGEKAGALFLAIKHYFMECNK